MNLEHWPTETNSSIFRTYLRFQWCSALGILSLTSPHSVLLRYFKGAQCHYFLEGKVHLWYMYTSLFKWREVEGLSSPLIFDSVILTQSRSPNIGQPSWLSQVTSIHLLSIETCRFSSLSCYESAQIHWLLWGKHWNSHLSLQATTVLAHLFSFIFPS